jgi:hypothetical protein
MSDVDNGRMTEQEALALIHGHSEDDWHECIRQGSEEYGKLKAPKPRWKIGCSHPSFALPSRAYNGFDDLVRSIKAQPWSKAAKALYLSGRTEDSLSPDTHREAEGGVGSRQNQYHPTDSARENFSNISPKRKRVRKRKKQKIKPNRKMLKTWADRREEIFRQTHVIREFTDLDGSRFVAWVPKDTSDKEALTAAFENSLAGHRQGKIKEQLFEIMKKRLEDL